MIWNRIIQDVPGASVVSSVSGFYRWNAGILPVPFPTQAIKPTLPDSSGAAFFVYAQRPGN